MNKPGDLSCHPSTAAQERPQRPGPETTARTLSDSTWKVEHERIRRTGRGCRNDAPHGPDGGGTNRRGTARARERSAREAAAGEDQIGCELRARLEGERAAARAQLAPALDARWWDNAKAEDIVRVHQTATAWKGHDPMARSAAGAIREQVQQRYGIDVDALGTGADGAAALNEAARAKTHAQEERTAVAAENIQASQLFTEAERADAAQRESVDADNTRPEQLTDEAAATYDSA